MTLNGAIKQLHELRSAEDMPIYYKPIIAEVINVLLMDTQEVKHGRWIRQLDTRFGHLLNDIIICSNCNIAFSSEQQIRRSYCPNCGVRMDDTPTEKVDIPTENTNRPIGEDKSHPFAESVMMGMDGGENG